VDRRRIDGTTLLIIAAQSGLVDQAQLLLEKGANVNAVWAGKGASALFMASLHGHTSTVKLLLKQGGNVDQATTDSSGHAPLYIAASNGHHEVVCAQTSCLGCLGYAALYERSASTGHPSWPSHSKRGLAILMGTSTVRCGYFHSVSSHRCTHRQGYFWRGARRLIDRARAEAGARH
jgi:hypothetical protein